uniref:Major facilitator superfamily (MFS) profile domain-containing protein n=1 Tax=Plectus sambesii TaxID=2011161 RepID=A0A914VIB1_9BILA
MAVWPYLNKLDPSASEGFLSVTVAVYAFTQTFSAPLLGYWANRCGRIKPPLIFAFGCLIVSNLLWMSLESIHVSGIKWVLLLSRCLAGTGHGAVGTLRGYVASASTPDGRGKAIGTAAVFFSIGLASGPIIQIAFSPLGYPGIQNDWFHFNIYTGPPLVLLVTNVAALVLLMKCFKETYVDVATTDDSKSSYGVVPSYDKLVIVVCCFTWFCVAICVAHVESVNTPYTMMIYGWTNEEAVVYNNIMAACQGTIDLAVFALFAIKLERILDYRHSIIAGLVVLLLSYIISFPWPMWPADIPLLSSSNLTSPDVNGCDAHMHAWCETSPRVNVWVYSFCFVAMLSVGFDMTTVCIITLYSKAIGPRRQGTLQGILWQAGCIAKTIGPLTMLHLLMAVGPQMLWLLLIGTYICSIIPWVIHYKRLIPLVVKAELKSGECVKYDQGIMYRF